MNELPKGQSRSRCCKRKEVHHRIADTKEIDLRFLYHGRPEVSRQWITGSLTARLVLRGFILNPSADADGTDPVADESCPACRTPRSSGRLTSFSRGQSGMPAS